MLYRIRYHLDRLAATDLDPGRTAAAIALGVFLSFSPLLGLQIVIGLAAAFAFRLSRVAVLLGLCANLPWIMVPWYMLTTAAAAAAMGIPTVDFSEGLFSARTFQLGVLERTGVIASGLFWPFVLGPTVGALVLGAIAYVVSFNMLSRRRERSRTALPREGDGSVGPAGDAEQRAPDRHVHEPQRARLEP